MKSAMKQMQSGPNNDEVCVCLVFYLNFKHFQSVLLLKLSEKDAEQFIA